MTQFVIGYAVLINDSVDGILWCDRPNRPSSAVLSKCIISFSVFYEIKLESFPMNFVFGHHCEWKVIKEPRYIMKMIRFLVVKSFRFIMKLIHFIIKFKLLHILSPCW